MKKKLVAMIVGLSVLLCSCGTTYEDAVNESKNTESRSGGYFTVIAEWDDMKREYSIVYANDTKVKYYIETSGRSRVIIPLYNADGSLQVYDGTEN